MTPPRQHAGRRFDKHDLLSIVERTLDYLCSEFAEYDLSDEEAALQRFAGALELFGSIAKRVLFDLGIDAHHLVETVGPSWVSDLVADLSGHGIGIWDGRWHEVGAVRQLDYEGYTGVVASDSMLVTPATLSDALRSSLSAFVDDSGGGYLADMAQCIADDLDITGGD